VTKVESKKPTVVIVGPPWPHGGSSRVFQNQIEYYKDRGYATIFLCVPLHCSYTNEYPEWNEIKAGFQELAADQMFFAAINRRRFIRSKYVSWIRHALRGTALDWIVFTAGAADLGSDAMQTLRDSAVVLLHVNHVFTAGFAQRLLRDVIPGGRNVPTILETHDVQSQALLDRHEINPWTHRYDGFPELVRSEISLLNEANALIHLSTDDFKFFKERLPQKRHVLVPPTIDEAFICRAKGGRPSGDRIDLLFVGQSTEPNLAAVRWFFEQVWPLIVEREYRLRIVGKIDMLARKELPGIYRTFAGYFAGPVVELAPYYSAARCVVSPMISGTGISIKTIEALALGKPFVGTSKAYRGMAIDMLGKFGLRANDTPQAFADAIVETLSDETMAAENSRRAYEELFSKRAAFSCRDEALRTALQQ
jgi:polysaccharide biosynthesis protein PslH